MPDREAFDAIAKIAGDGQLPGKVFPLPEKTLKNSPFARIKEHVSAHNVAKSAVRALDILELLVESGTPLRAIEIARSLAISPSSANQILKTMMNSGYLIFDATTKHYVLSARLIRLSASLNAGYFGADAITRLLHSVQEATGEVVLLTASQSTFMQIIDFCGPAENGTASGKIESASTNGLRGLQFSVFGSCSGAAWLATQSEEVVLKTIQRCRRELGQRAGYVEGVLASLRRVREQGYSFGGLLVDQDIEALAVALPPGPNNVVLVIVVAADLEVIEQRRTEIFRLITERIDRYLKPGASDQIMA